MKYLRIFLLCLTTLTATASIAQDAVPEDVASFLASRKLVSIVYFQPNSCALSGLAKQSLDSAVPRLSLLDMKKVVVRIEGFAPNEGDAGISIPLSMNRALAVMNYLREQYRLETGLFLIGCGDRDLADLPEEKQRRVEIALYDNLWNIEEAPVGELILNW